MICTLAQSHNDNRVVFNQESCFVMFFNVALDTYNAGKSTNANFGTTIRCAVAFGCHRMLVVGVGRPRFSSHGSFGSAKYLPVRYFSNWKDARRNLEAEGCQLIGIQRARDVEELGTPSIPVHERPFTGPTVFVTPGKGQVMTAEQRAACHSFVHVPICDTWKEAFADGTAILDNDVTLSITLHHFTSWAQSTANSFTGAKYVLGAPGRLGDVDDAERYRLQEMRRRQREGADVMEKRIDIQEENDDEEEEEEEGNGGLDGIMGDLWAEEEEEGHI